MVKNRVLYLKKESIDGTEHKFLLIHHFKIDQQNPKYFTTKNEFLYGDTANKYSVFGFIDDSFKINVMGTNKFFFLLEYPQQSCHFYFSQNTNPIEAIDDSDVYMDMKNKTCKSDVEFNGLTQHDSDATYLDGVKTRSGAVWYYAIGQRVPWGTKDQIPAFLSSVDAEIITELSLYIQIENQSLLSKFQSFYSCKQRMWRIFNPLIFAYLFVLKK